MASIGGQSFITAKGPSDYKQESLREITRPNVDGVAYQKAGRRGMPFQVTTVADAVDAAAIKTLQTSYKALVGTLVSFTDDLGNVWTNCVVVAVRAVHIRRVLQATGGLGSGNWLLTAQWLLRTTEDTA